MKGERMVENEAPELNTEEQPVKEDTPQVFDETDDSVEIEEGKVTYVGDADDDNEKDKDEKPAVDKAVKVNKKQVITLPQSSQAPKEEITKHDVSTILANAKNYVYTIYTDLEQGSGFIYNNKGDILTNAHVTKDASYVTVVNSKGQEFNGEVIGISDETDVSLIRVKELKGKSPMGYEMGKVKNGTSVIAIGSPENIRNTSSKGKILSYGKEFYDDYYYSDLYETDALIKNGSSGGPLISAVSGKIIGINSIILLDNPKIGFAIPISLVSKLVNDWAKNPALDVEEEEEEEEEEHNIKDSYLDETLLANYVQDFYKLLTYTLKEQDIDYYQTFLLPGSPAVEKGKKMAESLMVNEGNFLKVESEIKKITIEKNVAKVKAQGIYVYEKRDDKKTLTVKKNATYSIVIDEYGDYQISDIEEEQQ